MAIFDVYPVFGRAGRLVRFGGSGMFNVLDPADGSAVTVTQGGLSVTQVTADTDGRVEFDTGSGGLTRVTLQDARANGISTEANAVDAYATEIGTQISTTGTAAHNAVVATVGAVSDAATAGLITNPSATRTAGDARYARTANRPVNLYDQGADPTGVTSASALLNSLSGRQVDIPPGEYRIGSAVTIPANTTWRAERGVTFKGQFASAGAMVTAAQPDIRIEGQATFDANALDGFALDVSGARFRADGVTVTNSVNHGIYVHSVDDVTLSNFRAINCGRAASPLSVGVYASAANRLRLTNCHAEGSYQQGFYLSGSLAGVDAQLTAITAVNNGGTGVDLRIPGSTVHGIIAHGNGNGGLSIALESSGVRSRDTLVTGVNCYSNNPGTGNYEVFIGSQDRVTVVGLKAYSTACPYGIRMSDSDRVLIVGAHVRGAHAGYLAALKIPSGPAVTNMEIYGSSFENHNNLATVMEVSDITGFKVAGSSIKGGNYGVTYIGACSDTDLRFGNTWGAIPQVRRVREISVTGTNRLPGAVPAAFTGTDATTGNSIISMLQAAGFYL